MAIRTLPFVPFEVSDGAARDIRCAWRYVVIKLTDIHGGDFRITVSLVASRIRYYSLFRKSAPDELIQVARHLDALPPDIEGEPLQSTIYKIAA